jgi:hypothetical protein
MRSIVLTLCLPLALMCGLVTDSFAQSGQVTPGSPDINCDASNTGYDVTWAGTWDMGSCDKVVGFVMPVYWGTMPAQRVDIANPGTGATVGKNVPHEWYMYGGMRPLTGVYVWFEFGYWSGDQWCCEASTTHVYCVCDGGGCFAKGTLVLTPDGDKPIEQIEVGDLVLSLPDERPGAAPVHCRVEKVIRRTGKLLDIHVEGKVLRATKEHPFYVKGKGWIAAGSLTTDDLLSSHDGRWMKVDSVAVCDDQSHNVYNLKLETFTTYFVGGGDWGFSAWVHQDCRSVNPTEDSGSTKIAPTAAAGTIKLRALRYAICGGPL